MNKKKKQVLRKHRKKIKKIKTKSKALREELKSQSLGKKVPTPE